MDTPSYDVIGIGNAIVDVIARADDDFIRRHGLLKSHMRLIEADEVQRLYKIMPPAVEISGGSAANTIAGVASFGGRGAYIGKVADDEFGHIFRHDIRSQGVSFDAPPSTGGAPTARSLILVTPDGQRTMNTYLGACRELDEADVDAAAIGAAQVLYLEGYLFDRPEAKRAFHKAATIAKAAGRQVALTLSDGFCVDRHRAEFLDLMRAKVDILFANVDEITSLYETSFDAACRQVRDDVRLAAVTRSEKGSLIITGPGTVEIAAVPVAEVVDTTGAGDLYASGFLYGHARGLPVETSGRLASLAAAEIISHIGARPEIPLEKLARGAGLIG